MDLISGKKTVKEEGVISHKIHKAIRDYLSKRPSTYPKFMADAFGKSFSDKMKPMFTEFIQAGSKWDKARTLEDQASIADAISDVAVKIRKELKIDKTILTQHRSSVVDITSSKAGSLAQINLVHKALKSKINRMSGSSKEERQAEKERKKNEKMQKNAEFFQSLEDDTKIFRETGSFNLNWIKSSNKQCALSRVFFCNNLSPEEYFDSQVCDKGLDPDKFRDVCNDLINHALNGINVLQEQRRLQ